MRLVQDANAQIYQTGRAHSPGGTSMATTLVACALRYDRVVVAHVGDSRCYLIRQGQARLLTRDHTVAQRAGSSRPAIEPRRPLRPPRAILSRSLGTDLFVNVETSDTRLSGRCAAALLRRSASLDTPSEMAAVAGTAPISTRRAKAGRIANERDGRDNISVQLIRVRSVERVGMYRGRPYKLR